MHSSYSTNPSKCIVCSNTLWSECPSTTRVIRSVFEHAYVMRCSQCGQGVLDPLPTQSIVDAIYASPDYLNAYDEAGKSFPMSGEELSQLLAPRFRILDRFLPNKGTILDVGASRGYFLDEARRQGWEIQGIEAGPESVQFAKDTFGIDIEIATLENATIPANSVDCIHLSHVLEHLLDPVESLTKLREILKPGGLLVVEVPYEFGDLFDQIREKGLKRPRSAYAVQSTHLHFFTIQSLTKLMEKLGLEVVYSSTPRRNRSNTSRIPLGKWVKSAVYQLESMLHLGPLIEVYARKKSS